MPKKKRESGTIEPRAKRTCVQATQQETMVLKPVTKSKFDKFKACLLDFEHKINEILYDLVNYEELNYEKCSELKRVIQLSAETNMAELKVNKGFQINDDETCLNFECKAKVKLAQKRNA